MATYKTFYNGSGMSPELEKVKFSEMLHAFRLIRQIPKANRIEIADAMLITTGNGTRKKMIVEMDQQIIAALCGDLDIRLNADIEPWYSTDKGLESVEHFIKFAHKEMDNDNASDAVAFLLSMVVQAENVGDMKKATLLKTAIAKAKAQGADLTPQIRQHIGKDWQRFLTPDISDTGLSQETMTVAAQLEANPGLLKRFEQFLESQNQPEPSSFSDGMKQFASEEPEKSGLLAKAKEKVVEASNGLGNDRVNWQGKHFSGLTVNVLDSDEDLEVGEVTIGQDKVQVYRTDDMDTWEPLGDNPQ